VGLVVGKRAPARIARISAIERASTTGVAYTMLDAMAEKLKMMPAAQVAELYGAFTAVPAAQDKHRALREEAYRKAEAGEYLFTPLDSETLSRR